METLVLYITLTTSAYYLAVRAKITQALWSRYPKWLDDYLLCSACSGFAYGLVVALAVGVPLDLPFLGLAGRFWLTPPIVALSSMVWTPIVAYMQTTALLGLGVPDARVQPEPVDAAP